MTFLDILAFLYFGSCCKLRWVFKSWLVAYVASVAEVALGRSQGIHWWSRMTFAPHISSASSVYFPLWAFYARSLQRVKTTRRFLLCLGSQKKKQPPVFVVIFDPWTWPTICPKGPAHWWSACCSMAFTMEYHHLNDIRIYGPCFLRESAVATWMSQSGWFVCLLPIRCFEMTCSKILPSGCGVDCSLRPMCSKSSGPCKRKLQSHI